MYSKSITSNVIYYVGDSFGKMTFNECFSSDGIHPTFNRLQKLLEKASFDIKDLNCNNKLKKVASDFISFYMINGIRLGPISDRHISLDEICLATGKNQTSEYVEAFNTIDEIHSYLTEMAKDKVLEAKCLCSYKGASHKTTTKDIKAVRETRRKYESAILIVLPLLDEYDATISIKNAHE